MKEKFIDILSFSKLSDIIFACKERIIFSSANLHEEIATALLEATKKGVKITLIIDPSEQNYRNGLGSIKSIAILKNQGIGGVEIYEVIGNQISFIIADEDGYIFFPQSRIIEEEPKGPNALRMDSILKLKIFAHYFPPKSERAKTQFIDSVITINESSKHELAAIVNCVKDNKTDISLNMLNETKFSRVKENLEINPPIQPDIKRITDTYTTKIKYVELKFTGSNFHSTKISIPKGILPIKDKKLKQLLETKLNLFTDVEDNTDIIAFNAIKLKVESLRDYTKSQNAFLTPITCRNKSVIKDFQIKDFKKIVEVINKDIEKFKKGTLEKLEEEILNRKKTIKEELLAFLRENPPKEEYKKYSANLFMQKIDDLAQGYVSMIKFPDLSDLLSDIELKYNFYDLPIEDFRDKELLEEFRAKGILNGEELNEIVSMNKAFQAAK